MAANCKQSEIDTCLNELSAFNLRRITGDDHLKELINEYFCYSNHVDDEISDLSDDDESDGEGCRVGLHADIGASLSDCSYDTGSNDGYSDHSEISYAIPLVELCGPYFKEPFYEKTSGRKEDPKLVNGMFACSCQLHYGQPCSSRYTQQQLLDLRRNHLDLTRADLDLVILAKISFGLHVGKTTISSKKKAQTDRQRDRLDYYYEGQKICRSTFMFMHAIFKDRLATLIKHYNENGLTPRVHRKTSKLPKLALSPEDCQAVINFIVNYAEVSAVLLPGRIASYKRENLKLLPSSISKPAMFCLYKETCCKMHRRAVASRTFYCLWRNYCPYILSTKPRSDLCVTCQKNITRIVRSANLYEDEKIAALERAQQHLNEALAERLVYTLAVAQCKAAVAQSQITKLQKPGGTTLDSSNNITAHYSFDFSHQVHYPYDPQQTGPIFFKSPRKCGLFGVMMEGLPQMVLFLLDEATVVHSGTNSIISMLDYFFEHYSLKETKLHLHAGNCGGHSKSNAMIHYLLWRVLTERHCEITLSFMPAGHARFAPDWCFAQFKRQFQKTKVDCLDDIGAVSAACLPNGLIIPQLCGTEEGRVIVPNYNWDSFLCPWMFYKLPPSFKKYHHFIMKNDGSVTCRERADGEPTTYQLLLPNVTVSAKRPDVVPPAGLSDNRREYLFQEIREFVAEKHRDRVCPMPDSGCQLVAPPPSTGATVMKTPKTDEDADAETPAVERKKRGRGRPRKAPPSDGPGRPRKLFCLQNK